MNLIVAVDNNWAIGCRGKLLNSIPEDMKFFRETTIGKAVIMGRKTLESLPNGMPLTQRTNIVLSRNKDFHAKGAVVVHSAAEAIKAAETFDSDDVYVIGGASIYEQFLPLCSVAHVTKMNYAYEADTYFKNLDEDSDWLLAAESEEKTYFDLEYKFEMYLRKDKLHELKRIDL